MIQRAGYVPLQSWYVPQLSFWFGGDIFDPDDRPVARWIRRRRFTAYQWIQSYSEELGCASADGFQERPGNFDSPENPFLVGKIVMEQQGPWMANYIAASEAPIFEVQVPTSEEWKLKDRTIQLRLGRRAVSHGRAGTRQMSATTVSMR